MGLLTQNRCPTKSQHHVCGCHGYISTAGLMCAPPSPLPPVTKPLVGLVTGHNKCSRSVIRVVIHALNSRGEYSVRRTTLAMELDHL